MSSGVATCRFYRAPGGCARGDDCRYRHHRPVLASGITQEETGVDTKVGGATEGSSSGRVLKPTREIDAPRLCKWFAAGYCSRGKSCWFRHDVEATSSEGEANAPAASPSADTNALPASEHNVDVEDCGICYDLPGVFGLLENCSHVFCLKCIREWRRKGKSNGDESPAPDQSNYKSCPLCRTASYFVIPSNTFEAGGDEKAKKVAAYKQKMGSVPCRVFEESKASDQGPFCPFGDDCFYRHFLRPEDTEPHRFLRSAAEMRNRSRGRRRAARVPRVGHNRGDLADMLADFNLFDASLDDDIDLDETGLLDDYMSFEPGLYF